MAITLFKNADEAYTYQLNRILIDGVDFDDTKALFNIGLQLKILWIIILQTKSVIGV